VHAEPKGLEVGRVYEADIDIKLNKATLSLDGKPYYSCWLKPGDIEQVGRVGFTSYSGFGSSEIFDVQ
jgi:hypothetical protein